MQTPALDPGAAASLRGVILSTSKGRRLHRLHAVLLVARGLSCRKAAALLGASPRSVLYWVRRFEKEALSGLSEKRKPGRPRSLSGAAAAAVAAALAQPPAPSESRHGRWSGAALSAHLLRVHQLVLSVRQCQRLLRERRRARAHD
jgi:transposase